MVFGAIDTRAEMADDPSVFADIDRSKVTFGEVEAAFADDYTEMIVSPGVALDHPLVVRARDRGCRVRGDIDLFSRGGPTRPSWASPAQTVSLR